MESNTSDSNNFLWSDVDWHALRELRARFLDFDQDATGAQPDRADYWRYPATLRSYDFTFAERIGWKWDTVIDELKTRGWSPPPGVALDWGCGTGVASRRVTAAWPDAARKLFLSDRSQAAARFAVERAREISPHLPSIAAMPPEDPELLILSHVLNELTAESLEQLLALVRKAQAVLWVEAGTWQVSRKLIAVREQLKDAFQIIAPCTHSQQCGMLTAGNERHWCHHFAKIPGFVHQDSGWSHFSTTLDIDISTLPFSYLVLDRRPAPAASDLSRVIGTPRIYKGFEKILSCQSDGVIDLTLQKRDAPELFKELRKDPGSLYRWEREGDRITGGARQF